MVDWDAGAATPVHGGAGAAGAGAELAMTEE